MPSPRVRLLALLAGVALLAGWWSGLLGRMGAAARDILLNCLRFIEGLDPVLAALTFVGLYVAATVLFLPGLLLTMAAGALFGLIKGTLLVSLASVTGASLAFLIGRHLARDAIARKLQGRARFRAIDEAIGREGVKIVFLLRLSPIFPFNLLNYALGLTGIRFGAYLLASWIGMIPGTIMYVYLGSVIGDVAALAAGSGGERSTSQWIFFGVGLLATIAVTILITRLARRALEDRLGDPGEEANAAANND